jgi:hypothetical protein
MEIIFAFLVGVIGIAGFILLMLGYSVLTWGLVTYKFYYWFLLTLIPAAPAITFTQAIMISLLLSLFKNHSTGHTIKKEYREDSGLSGMFLMPWLSLLFGWVVHIFL